jgi:hypothetical protein
MRGQTIVVKDVSGLPLIVRLWSFNDSGVFIHSEEEFNRRMSGEKALDPVGFPYEDAFEYDNTAREVLKDSPMHWAKLRPLRCPVTAVLK